MHTLRSFYAGNLMQSGNMKTPRVHALLLCIIATITLVHGSTSCISDSEVEEIAQRWLNAFATGGLSTLSGAVTENVREFIPHLHPYIQLKIIN